MVRTYEGFLDFFTARKKSKIRKTDIDTGRLPKDIPVGEEVSKRVRHFFDTTSFSDFNYIIQELTDEYGGGKISYILETEYATLMIEGENDKFKIIKADLEFMNKSQDYILDRSGKYAKIKVCIDNFNFEDDGLIQTHLYNLNNNKLDQSEFISEVGERLMDMCPDIKSYRVGKNKYDEYKQVIQFNF